MFVLSFFASPDSLDPRPSFRFYNGYKSENSAWDRGYITDSLDPRLIRLQLNARSPPWPGIDCIWA